MACGALTVLTIHPSRWQVHFDGKTVSLAGPTGGSVWANSGCGLEVRAVISWMDGVGQASRSAVNPPSVPEPLGSRTNGPGPPHQEMPAGSARTSSRLRASRPQAMATRWTVWP